MQYLAIIFSVIAGAVWFVYSLVNTSNGDLFSAALLLILPTLAIALRNPLDRLFKPLDGMIGIIPLFLRRLLALAIPFLLGALIWLLGIQTYCCLQIAILVSIGMSILLTRRVGSG